MRASIPRTIIIILIIAVLPALALGAKVSGQAYDGNYEPLKNVLVEVTTHPKQSLVARDGYYEFTLTPGRYELNAYHRSQNGTAVFTSKVVFVSGSGEYIVDLILDEEFTGELPSESLPFHLQVLSWIRNNYQIIILVFVVIVGISIFIIILRHRKPAKSKQLALDNGLDRVVIILKKSGGRLTQKELRKKIPNLSEAKISLMVTELEAKGLLEKIKKGRGNVIVLKRRV